MNLDQFASRGLKAQQAVDDVLTKLPAAGPAGTAKPNPGAGLPVAAAPRSSPAKSATDLLQQIERSQDVPWLKRMVADGDLPLGARNAADRRLRKLVRKPKL